MSSVADKPKKKSKRSAEEVTEPAEGERSSKKSKKSEEIIELGPEQLSPIAHPLADKKLRKKVLRTVKKAAKQRQIKRGVKEVVKALRKGEKGLIVMAGDISPIDILSHIPVLCEDHSCPYVFISSKELLGQASSTKRPTSCIMITLLTEEKMNKPGNKKAKELVQAAKLDPEKQKDVDEYKESYDQVWAEVHALNEVSSVPVSL